jgi:D-hexose-6-phosphate mutarotase
MQPALVLARSAMAVNHRVMTLPPSIHLDDSKPGYPFLRINHAAATGTIALLGAHVMEWTPRGHSPVLFMSADAVFEDGVAIRGGIPLCWPWFGPRPGLPGHGCVRTRFWQLASATENESGVRLAFTFASDEATLKMWPHAFELELVVEMGNALDVTLRMKHLGSEPVNITGALHTYLTVSAIEQTTVLGLDGTQYSDTIDHDQIKSQQGDVLFDREVDRVYQSSGEVRVDDRAGNRTLVVTKTGSAATVVWNPWIEKSKRLSDLPDEAFHSFLCIEAANAGADVVHLAPGQEHVLGTRVECV